MMIYYKTLIVLSALLCRIWCCPSTNLGLLDGSVWLEQLSSSATHASCSLSSLRLHSKRAWCAANSSDIFVQVDLGAKAVINAIVTQGGQQGFITGLSIEYSEDSIKPMQFVMDENTGKPKVFRANRDKHEPRIIYLPHSITARVIRIRPVKWTEMPSLRLELVGCQECLEVLSRAGLASVSEVVPRRHRRRRRRRHRCSPLMADLDSPHGWCPRKQTRNQFLQFDLGPPTRVTAVVTRGQADRSRFVRTYSLSFSNDSIHWIQYTEPNALYPKVFEGNKEQWGSVRHFLSEPPVARFVRLQPQTWHRRIGLRAALLGCPHKGECPQGFFRINERSQCVPNKAYKGLATVNGKEVSREFEYGHPKLAVDGVGIGALHTCAIVDSFELEQPFITVDLGRNVDVEGVLMHMWQGLGQDELTSFADYVLSLGELHVHVGHSMPAVATSSNSSTLGFLCGSVTRRALFRPDVHVECGEKLRGRYISLRVKGAKERWRRIFVFVLCELNVY